MLPKLLWAVLTLAAASCASNASSLTLPPLAAVGARPNAHAGSGRHDKASELALAEGLAALRAGGYRAAQRALLEAVRGLPDDPRVRSALAEVWLMMGTVEGDLSVLRLAKQAAEQAVVLAPESEPARYLAKIIADSLQLQERKSSASPR